ncbi:hypothetical protein [Dyadobacter sp. CY323]|uniref:hypothetical protein n=1 Tax=Dyadobacter sp. CY323 TaxID=2907302 RepID=UPI001F1EE165|nr:hypothetical protein [Dyadobacter sp. CY323]MCE6992106.1 hypothetical protein [Dyadobacter sp. CY323]
MAYGTKYQAKYKSGTRVRTILLQQEGYAGGITEWFVSTNAPRREQGAADSIFGECIITSVLRLEFMFDQHYDLTSFVAEPRTYKVIVLEGATVLWSGWVEPYDTSRDYRGPNYFVSMAASCGLNRLAKKVFVPIGYNEAQVNLSYIQIMKICLASIGIDRVLRVSLYTYMNASPSAPNPLGSVFLSIYRYFPSGQWLDCRTIIIDILQKFNAELFLHNNMWVIRGKVDHGLGFTGYVEFPIEGDPFIVNEWPGGIELAVNNENNGAIDGGLVSLQAPVRKYTVKADMSGLIPSFTNGGMQLWEEGGLVGWHFIIPPLNVHGWQKRETGIDGSPFALYIKGFAQHPYFKFKKKGVWPFRKTVTVPIEPDLWIETPAIRIKPTDEQVTVGFEYYTDPDAEGFFYSIHIGMDNPNSKYPEVLWYKPSGATLITNEFNHLIAAPHPKINPENGVTQSKGKVEVTFKTDEFNKNPWVNSPDKPVYTYIKIRFYYMMNFTNKTGDGYTIYSVTGKTASENEPASGDSQYKVTLEQENNESEEGETINLISGDYSEGFLGATFWPDGPTGKWKRRENDEAFSIYRVMLLDRLAVTYATPDVIEASFKILPGGQDISFLNYLRFTDRGDQLFKIVRFSFDEYRRIASVTAVEFNYTTLTNVIQKNYTDAQGLLDSETNGDGIYPGDGTPSGRIGAEEELLPEDTETETKNGRTGIFEDVPTLYYTVSERSFDSVNLEEFLSEAYLDEEQGEDIEEEDRHDPADFVLSLVDKPAWVESVVIEGLNVSATAKPTVTGTFYLILSVVDDAFGVIPNVKIPIIVYPKTVIKYTLLDTSGDAPVIVGSLPGSWPLPARWNIQINISGPHDAYQFTTQGGGATGKEISETRAETVNTTQQGTYLMFEGDGLTTSAGLFRTYALTILEDRNVSNQNITFVLYDDEFLNTAKFFFTQGAADISQIDPAGTSKFEDPGTWDTRALIAETPHDKAIIRLNADDGSVIKERVITHEDPVTDQSYPVYGADEAHPLAQYNTSILLLLEGAEVLMRYVDFETVKKKPEPVGGLMQLLEKADNSQSFTVVGDLPETGGSFDLVPWNIGSDAETDPFDWEGDYMAQLKGGKWVEVDISKHTGRPQFVAYGYEITFSDYKAFDNLSSVDIGKIHGEPSTFQYIRTRKLGGQSGEVSAILKTEFSFGPAVDTGDVEDSDPTAEIVAVRAGAGMRERVVDYVKYLDNAVDGETLEVFEPESPDDPDSDPVNHIRVKQNGILFEHIQEIPTMTLIGNLTAGDLTPYAVLVKDIFEEAEVGDLVTPIAIHNHMVTYVTEQLEDAITGTIGYVPIYNTVHTFEDSIIRQLAGKVGFGIDATETIHASGNILATGQLKSGIATGTAPITVLSTTLVTNLNADYLDGEHGAFYLNWDNFTNYKSILAGNGMTGGGLLDLSRTLTLGLPSTLTNSTTNAVSTSSHTHEIETSDLIAGTNIHFSTSGAGVILGPSNIVISAISMPWNDVTSKPTDLAGFGILDGVTYTQHITALALKENTFAKGDII